MSELLTGCLGFLVGGGWVYWVMGKQAQYLKDELTTAQDRLYHAWRDERIVVPPREAVIPQKQVEEALPPAALDLVLDYESPEGRQAAEQKVRQRLKQGWGMDRIREDLRS